MSVIASLQNKLYALEKQMETTKDPEGLDVKIDKVSQKLDIALAGVASAKMRLEQRMAEPVFM